LAASFEQSRSLPDPGDEGRASQQDGNATFPGERKDALA
jgi:hypothetical protein